jgi:hypothetical protein
MALVVWRTGAWKLEIVKRSDTKGFERTFSAPGRHRYRALRISR